jgi:hypothetical protein
MEGLSMQWRPCGAVPDAIRRPLTVMFPWLWSGAAYVDKYVALLHSLGFDVLLVSWSFTAMWVPIWILHMAWKVIEAVGKDLQQAGERPVVFYAFSGAAKVRASASNLPAKLRQALAVHLISRICASLRLPVPATLQAASATGLHQPILQAACYTSVCSLLVIASFLQVADGCMLPRCLQGVFSSILSLLARQHPLSQQQAATAAAVLRCSVGCVYDSCPVDFTSAAVSSTCTSSVHTSPQLTACHAASSIVQLMFVEHVSVQCIGVHLGEG